MVATLRANSFARAWVCFDVAATEQRGCWNLVSHERVENAHDTSVFVAVRGALYRGVCSFCFDVFGCRAGRVDDCVHGLDAGSSDLDSLGLALSVCVGVNFRQALSVGVVFAYARVDGVAVAAAARALLGGCAVGGVAIDWVT
jgi:hypothetical protein